MSNIVSTYDNEWSINITNSNASLSELQSVKGSFLGNGKIGYVTRLDQIGVQKSLVTVDFDFDEAGLYKNNIADGFDTTVLKFIDNFPAALTVGSNEFVQQTLNMYTGISTTEFLISNASNNDVFDVSYDLYPVRNMPYSTVQTFNITPHQNTSNLSLYHEIACGNNIINVEYNNNTVYNDLVNPTGGLYILSGKGQFKDTHKAIGVASTYCFESPSNMSPVGFNVYATDVNKCFQKLAFVNLVANVTYKLHIVTCQMTEYDFKRPQDEVKRVICNIFNKPDYVSSVYKIRQNHVAEWANMWQSNITINAKTGITTGEADDLNAIKRMIRYSLFNVWCAVRDGIRTEMNPVSISVFDTFGTLFWDGDLWFIPLLILFKPNIARTMLEARYAQMDQAMKLAAGYGYNGSKFPYMNDVVGYVNSLYWDVRGPMHIFNTALVSINVWNYYRVSQDRDWLVNKGYSILKNNADFFASKIEVDNDGTYHIRGVYSFNNRLSDDNALTNYLVKSALKHAIEASYETGYAVKDAWMRGFYNLDMSYFPSPPNPLEVIMNDSATATTDSYNFLEQMIPLLTYYNRTFFAANISRDWTSIQRNLNFLGPQISPGFTQNPMNNMITTWINGSMTNYDTSYPDLFNAGLKNIVQNNMVGIWGGLNMENTDNDYSDLSLGALFLLTIMCTMGTMRVTGAVSDTRFYTESMGIHNDPTCSMPKTWKNIQITGVGADSDTITVMNTVFYP